MYQFICTLLTISANAAALSAVHMPIKYCNNSQDAVTVKIFSSICKVSDCVDHNVALIEDLEKNRTPMPETAGTPPKSPDSEV